MDVPRLANVSAQCPCPQKAGTSDRTTTGNAPRTRTRHSHQNIEPNNSAIGSARLGVLVNGSGKILATRSRIENNDPAAMNSAKHMRHKCRARREPPRG